MWQRGITMSGSFSDNIVKTGNEEGRSRVVVLYCDSYDEEIIYRKMKRGISMLGGPEAFVKPDEKILVKPNYLYPADPEKAVTTHPSVIKGMLRILQEYGCGSVKYGDSPGSSSAESVDRKLGLSDADGRCYGAEKASMNKEVHVDFPEGMTAKEFYFTEEVTEADAIISLCKMKTHALERITGAVKNFYGTICGYRKAAGHVKYPNDSIFARMLADIHRYLKPRLHIMDGVLAMEGNGPGSGDPVKMNVLLFSTDPVALDAVYCALVDLDPELIPTCVQGEAMGIGTYHFDKIDIITADEDTGETAVADGTAAAGHANTANILDITDAAGAVETADPAKIAVTEKNAIIAGAADAFGGTAAFSEKCSVSEPGMLISKEELFRRYGNASFDVPRAKQKGNFLLNFSRFMTGISRRPYIKKELCVKCGICVEHCPVAGKAVNFRNADRTQPPEYNYRKCIRCYCCQEMCPQHAIRVKG